jgi:hypothetical protein
MVRTASIRLNRPEHRARGPTIERNNDILPNGRLFGTVPAGPTVAASTPQIDVVLNWFAELQKRVPTR